jgi:hypothetical protein
MYGLRGLGFTLASDLQSSVVRNVGDVFETQLDSGGDYQGRVGARGGDTLTQWLNHNAGKVAIGAAAFLGLVFLAKARR